MESSNTTTLRTRRRIQPTCIFLLAVTTITTTTLFVWKSSSSNHHGSPFRGSQNNERISSDVNSGNRHGRPSSPDNVEINNSTEVYTDTKVRSSSAAAVITEINQHHEEHNHHNYDDTNIRTTPYYHHDEDDDTARDGYYYNFNDDLEAGEDDYDDYDPFDYETFKINNEEEMIFDETYYDYYYDDNDSFDDEDEYDAYYYSDYDDSNDDHIQDQISNDEEEETKRNDFLNAMLSLEEENDEQQSADGRNLRYRRRRYYGIGNRQNFCLSRGCVGHNQCYNINCNAGCFGGRCQAGSRYNHGNRYYRYRNRYYYRRRRKRRYYYNINRNIVCANNLGCTGTALPYCIRGFCQATNYGQFCVANGGCANGIYNQCINGACTGRLIGGGYYDYNRIVDCVSTERELRLRLEGNVIGNNIVVNICSPSTIFVSTVITSSINNLELNCVISGTGGVLGNNCKFMSQGSRTNFLRLLGSNVIIRGMTFENGFSSTNGGAIDMLGSGQHRIVDCTFNGNRAIQRGGAVHIPSSSNVILINNEFNGNQALQCVDVFVQGSCRNS